jgi:RNA polymerase sigma-70 factor, ECF subfamily
VGRCGPFATRSEGQDGILPSVEGGGDATTGEAFEVDVRRLLDGGDPAAATSLVLRRLGPEILGMLVALHRDADEAADAFSLFAEKLWLTFSKFEGRCSVRTWSYVLARRAGHDVRRRERRHGRKAYALSEVPEIEAIAERVRTATLTMLRTETKSKLVELRETLPEDDQLLLVLRVDRKLSWDALAFVFLDEGADAAALERECARLRKRYQLTKERLRALAVEHGLIEERS